jgi:hypothetical protein
MSTLLSLYFHCLRDGLHNSICRNCFVTVSSKKNEIDLAKAEDRHVCNPDDVYFFSVAEPDSLPNNLGAKVP